MIRACGRDFDWTRRHSMSLVRPEAFAWVNEQHHHSPRSISY